MAAIASLPSALVVRETFVAASTTTPAALQASGFAADRLPGPRATDRALARDATHFGVADRGAVAPVYAWARTGPPPPCPTLARASWTTRGIPVGFFRRGVTLSPGRDTH